MQLNGHALKAIAIQEYTTNIHPTHVSIIKF